MPAAPPSTAGSTASSNSRSHYQHVSGQGGPHSNSASPKPSAKEEARMAEDGPSSRSSKPDSKEGDRAKRQKTNDDSQPEGSQTCLGCKATSTPEWRRGPMGPRTLCNACGLVYAKMIKKRYKDKSTNPKKPSSTGGGSNKIGGATTTVLGGGVGAQMHVIGLEESDDESEDEDDYPPSTSSRRNDNSG
ncbi:hypothetical protein M413DRAFT_9074 [Hebeloma cylindrosporum]|uniref:GATA-type domain-containing protein n=1 Tax=Hebeloma cylindrosporum TaxID=76867 RepID=A0A0C3C7E8_HEBCY|nr:hypothetical protein M413DRAFT_9074 [Hebeloma cylindrosporum h7]